MYMAEHVLRGLTISGNTPSPQLQLHFIADLQCYYHLDTAIYFFIKVLFSCPSYCSVTIRLP